MTYAIFSTGGAQFRAEPGVTIKVPLLEAEPGSKVTFDRVLLASDGKQVQAGKPVVKGAKVTAEVVRHGKGEKIRIYRFARRSGYRRHAGHRQPFTEVKIADVKFKDGEIRHGTQEGCRLVPHRPRFGSEIPRREAVRRGACHRGDHPGTPAGHENPSRDQRAAWLRRHVVHGRGRTGEIRAQEQEAVQSQRVSGGGEKLGR